MKSLKEVAIVAALIDRLRDKGSWCGETHLQKASYFLTTLFETPLEAEFVMYKHGPFSFDLRDSLGEARSRRFIALEPQDYPYGPRLAVTPHGKSLEERYSSFLESFNERLEFVADTLGNMGVASLERLATALYLHNENDSKSRADLVEQMVALKPHISREQAEDSFTRLDTILEEAKRVAAA